MTIRSPVPSRESAECHRRAGAGIARREYGGIAMGLPASEQFVLSVIEDELQTTDPELSIAFASFTSVTYAASMPGTEQLGTVRAAAAVTGTGRRRRTCLNPVLGLPMTLIVGALRAPCACSLV